MTGQRIAVTGIGLLTPCGMGTQPSWDGVCRGVSAAAKDPELTGVPTDFSCRVPEFDPLAQLGRQVWRMDRFVQLALAAAREAVHDAGLTSTSWDRTRTAAVMGVGSESRAALMEATHRYFQGTTDTISPLTIPRITTNMAAGEIAIDQGLLGPTLAVSTACASGATALGTARDLLLTKRCDVVLAGGTEAPCHPLTSLAFSRMKALSRRADDPRHASRPFDRDRDGFVLGEAAGVLVLEREADARARGASVHAYLAGYGTATDAYHYAASHPQGRGIIQAFRTALADADLAPDDIHHVNAHGTSTPMNDLLEARALNHLFPTGPPPVTSTKGVTGHTIGAAGAIEAAFCVLTLRDQRIPPTANHERTDPEIDLDVVTGAPREHRMRTVASNSIGFGGHNAVVVFQAP
ncbi:beta-ketoacyl-[acyl-carrier-protein] synthase family protein [Streptomyces sp. PTM05]|uniref:Beta-ketoacyl-[acyl-carrier-protein] synthase family protein n=1 Tax=Streptantibioticus parmotrematis TaxID=2873249 RepID=A0ABS7QUR0_9ACTN|nr:beta-ketoacyl-[acyl-carrier-protein] synthase family protein [Streptantibioticus parmotrematis]MBY8886110.1 beta-ketoacyl-[acyl-carrier-protein] synthase family protein [Streptantibioticus parmotrematis]